MKKFSNIDIAVLAICLFAGLKTLKRQSAGNGAPQALQEGSRTPQTLATSDVTLAPTVSTFTAGVVSR